MALSPEEHERVHKQEVALVQQAAESAATSTFTDAHVQNTPKQEREVQGLGCVLSRWAEWDLYTLLDVFEAALEDSNMPERMNKVSEMRTLLSKEMATI